MNSSAPAKRWFCIGLLEADAKACGALTGAVSGLFRPEEGWSLDLVRIRAGGAPDDRQEVAQFRRALLPTSVDVFDLRQGRDWMSGDEFLRGASEPALPSEGGRPRVVVTPGQIDRLDEILERRSDARSVFLTGLGPWRDFFGGELCMRLTKRWILMDDPTFRLEPVATFANFATVGKVDRTWVEWLLFERAFADRPDPTDEPVVALDLAEGLPIGRDRVAAYLETLKRMLRG
ncbi:MAG: hypothetical protein QM608_19585 [Caulobacter sp.]